MSESLIYFRDGDLIAVSGAARVYKMADNLYLEKGKGHTLWAHSGEIEQYIEQLKNFPKGNCLEIGLGLGISSRYILSFPSVKSLTTVEIDEDIISVQKEVNFIDDRRHKILNADGLLYAYKTKSIFDFIFLDFYTHIDEETLPSITDMANACRRILKPKGHMMGWIDPATSGEHYNIFITVVEES
jgi:spermidine synthase